MTLIDSARADIHRAIQSAETITVISHYNPDSDAYGSSLGLSEALRLAGKKVTTINHSGISTKYSALPLIHTIVDTPPSVLGLLIVCDCGSFNRVGDELLPLLSGAPQIINIDHHISNDTFGHINLVDTSSSSTSEVVYDLLKSGSYVINQEIATCLLAGIIGDTGSFRYSSTSPQTFRVAADLMELGASPTKLFKSLYGSSPRGAVKLQAECMLNADFSCNGQFAEIIVTQAQLKLHGASLEDAEGLVERARDIEGVKIAASIREDGEIWRVSLRSSDDRYNVSDIAATFGGGGHIQAAAFRSRKPLTEIRRMLGDKIAEVLS